MSDARRLREIALQTVNSVRAIGEAYREDWSNFDGRHLRRELIEATEELAALARGK